MSEGEAVYFVGVNRYHQVPDRTLQQIDAAYHAALTSPAGQMVMDDLYSYCCYTFRPVEEQHLEPGIKALWLHILARLAAHEHRGRASERGDDGRGEYPKL